MSQLADPAEASAEVLRVRGITKSFGPNRVLRGVGLSINRGTIYGLMGANGAGKSTLIKILSGAEKPDGGTILLAGEQVSFADPLAATRRGIGTVHQNPNDGVVLDMTVAENLALDQLTDPGGPRMFTMRRTESHARAVADTLGLSLSRSVMRSPVRDLGVSERQLLVLARALSRSPELLILDEPTSALSAEETARLFALVNEQVAGGMTVLFVSHKLADFDTLCHHVGVLRDGAMQGEFDKAAPAGTVAAGEKAVPGLPQRGSAPAGGFNWPVVLQALFDRSPAEMKRTELVGDDVVLQMTGVQVLAESEPFDLQLRQGEVTVLLGLLGSGKTELLEWLFGARSALAGAIALDGKPFAPHHPDQARDRGVYLVPESRHEQAIIPGWSLSQQMTLPFIRSYSTAMLMSGRRERTAARTMMNRIGVVAQGPGSAIETLSGGNQQKVVIGRWLLGDPRVLLLDEPFRGVDINARHDIGETIRTLSAGAAVLVATSDLDEAMEVADRLLVFRQGSVAADVRLSEATRSGLIEAMSSRASTLIAGETDESDAGSALDATEDPLERAGLSEVDADPAGSDRPADLRKDHR
ncbi:MAG: sugar ABC transporter ATP-binding protein [Actinomycetota bacterium]|nr:sugar ABC transporter ATP-binding protein [Actinomycetota bacterium]